MAYCLEIGLWHDNCEHAEDEGNQEPHSPLFSELSGVSEAQGEIAAGSGEDEEERHNPPVEEGNYDGRDNAGGSILHMPVGEHVKKSGIVKEENTNHREDSKPVKVVSSSKFGCYTRTGILGWATVHNFPLGLPPVIGPPLKLVLPVCLLLEQVGDNQEYCVVEFDCTPSAIDQSRS